MGYRKLSIEHQNWFSFPRIEGVIYLYCRTDSDVTVRSGHPNNFSAVFLTVVTRYKELLFLVQNFFRSSFTPVEAREVTQVLCSVVKFVWLYFFHDCTPKVVWECFIL